MEGHFSAAPRLARDFYNEYYGWTLSGAALEEASATAKHATLHAAEITLPKSASDPQEGQAPKHAVNKDQHLAMSLEEERSILSTMAASDPQPKGQASRPHEEASDPQSGGQASPHAVNDDLHGASDRVKSSRHALFQGKHAVNFNLQFMAALCGMPIHHVQDMTLLKGGLRQFAALESFKGRAATLLQPAASTSIPTPLAAHPQVSSSAPLFTSSVIPTNSPQSISSVSTGSSKLRALASPWQPNKPPLPFLLIGDIPVLSMFLSPKLSHPLLLPGARQSPASPLPAETLGFKQPQCCFYCGNRGHSIRCGSSSTSALGFSPLKGENVHVQAQESYAAAHPKVMQARRANRPRFKMKSEVQKFNIQKANLDPG